MDTSHKNDKAICQTDDPLLAALEKAAGDGPPLAKLAACGCGEGSKVGPPRTLARPLMSEETLHLFLDHQHPELAAVGRILGRSLGLLQGEALAHGLRRALNKRRQGGERHSSTMVKLLVSWPSEQTTSVNAFLVGPCAPVFSGPRFAVGAAENRSRTCTEGTGTLDAFSSALRLSSRWGIDITIEPPIGDSNRPGHGAELADLEHDQAVDKLRQAAERIADRVTALAMMGDISIELTDCIHELLVCCLRDGLL